MSDRKQLAPHPPEDQLLRLADGELSAREAAATRNHLELCWQCRSRLDELGAGIADYMRYEEQVLKPLLPSPPHPWTDLSQRLGQLDATAVLPRKTQNRWIPPTWLAVAAMLLLVVLAVWRFERVPAVSAAELLRKAAASESSRPVKQRRIQIRTRRRNYTRSATLRKPAAATTAVDSGAAAELQKLFEAARFSWDDPLSVEAYRSWHDQLPEKRDDVKTIASDYVIHTSTTSSVLTDATLTIRGQDLHSVHERLQFQLGEWVEISELTDEASAPSVTTPGAPAHKEETPRVGEPDVAPGPAQELQVTWALHRMGADLGEPIEVTRGGSKLVVAAMGLGPSRQNQLRAAVAQIPGVEVRFDQPELMSSRPGLAVQPRRNTTGTLSALQLRIQNQLGDPGSVEEFTNHVLDASEAAMARAFALRALARRFTPEIESQLSPADQNILAGLRHDHISALRVQVREIDRLLEPAMADLASSRDTPAVAASLNWQTQVEQFFVSMQRVDQLLSAMLAGGDTAGAGQSPGQLATALVLLETQLSAR